MAYFSSSKNAWPTKNLFIGGGPSRPLNRISITVTKPKTGIQIGPTVKAAKKVKVQNREIYLTTRIAQLKADMTPKQNQVSKFLDKFLEHPAPDTYPAQITPRKRTSHHRSVEDAMGAQQ